VLSAWGSSSTRWVGVVREGEVDPLGLLPCPDEHMDPLGYQCWNGNDHMILGYMQSQMYSAEIQYITPCLTAVQAYQTLCRHHKKQSGLMQIQLIQKLMQLSLKDNEDIYKTSMTTWQDLIYRIESIGHVDVQ
jgi:hypothetical protein